jgi:DNA-binding LacI/PurR family transcriptional regulator
MAELLERRPDIDAVFAANDLMAAGALQVLRERGREVPGDVAVVGFDDAPMAQFTDPALTTVQQSPEEMGREMVAMLVRLIEDELPVGSSRVLDTRLVVRASA